MLLLRLYYFLFQYLWLARLQQYLQHLLHLLHHLHHQQRLLVGLLLEERFGLWYRLKMLLLYFEQIQMREERQIRGCQY